jgi:hypothetical protein
VPAPGAVTGGVLIFSLGLRHCEFRFGGLEFGLDLGMRASIFFTANFLRLISSVLIAF